MASNSGGLRDGDGDSSDWIELYNTTSAPINLTGYHLTDSAANLSKWTFPSGTQIGANSTLLVFASDKNATGPVGELHTNFKLSADGEYLGLVGPDGTTVLHAYNPAFPSQVTNVSYGVAMSSASTTLVDDATPMRHVVPTNSASDATWKQIGFNDSSWSSGTAGLGYEQSSGEPSYTSLIDSVLPAGTTSAYARFAFNLINPFDFDALSLGMIYDDGFVAYLNGQLVASANAPANPIWNSQAGSEFRSDETILSAFVNFDLSGYINLLVPGVNVLAIHALNNTSSSDMLMIPRLVGSSSALPEPLIYGSFGSPTPNAPNGEVFVGVVADTAFSVDRGFYNAEFDVAISTETPGALIVYTTDGSEPLVDSSLNILNGFAYGSPLNISHTTTLRAAAFKSGFIPTNIDTQTYLFVSDVVEQTYASAISVGFPSSWGGRPADYGLDPDVVGPNDLFNGVYAAQIEANLLAIPTISLVLDNDDMFGPTGIYSNPTGEGVLWERSVSAEWILPDGAEGFQIDAGIRIAGAASRSLSLKNGMRLLFKSEYGDSKLRYPLFGEGVDEFDTIVLRPHFNDGWGWDGALGDPLYSRDQWFRNTQIDMGSLAPRGNLAHLYINGQYWGLYNPSERPDDSFNAENFGGDKTEYDVMVSTGVHDGTADAYNTMIALAQSVTSASGVAAKNAAYQLLQGNLPSGAPNPASEDFLDVVNYIDYMLLNHYGGNDDWPDRNWYAARRRGDLSEGFKFFTWDSEISLDLSDRTSLQESYIGVSTGAAEAYGILRDYEEFRLQFADRVHHHLFNGGALYVNPLSPNYDPAHPENNLPAARFAEIAEQVGQAIVAESARWGDQHVSAPRTKNIDWQNSLDYVLGTYFTQRHGIVLNQWRAAGLYPTTNAPEILIDGARQHGGVIDQGGVLSFENSNPSNPGTIYYTTDGSDPRLVGGAVNTASAQVFNSAVSLQTMTQVKARILRNGEWSALTEASFQISNADFNEDGVVNASDYDIWRSHYGKTTDVSKSDGDANNDGRVDAADYTVWRDTFGTVSPATLIVANVWAETGDSNLAESAPSLSSSVGAATQPTFFALSVAKTSLGPQSNKLRLEASGVYHDRAFELLFNEAAVLDAKADGRNAVESVRRLASRSQTTDKNDPVANKVGLSQFDDWVLPSSPLRNS